MNEDFTMYRYFKGEKENTYDYKKGNAAFIFWSYEKMFEGRFNEGDFTFTGRQLRHLCKFGHNLLSGKPLHEPMACYGPFVMNTREEIEETLQEIGSGKCGK